ncbi:hypothetical protein BGAL_0062g00140 [Botrytis galanthina]|uniref:Uncharacterized protein n=1 Tax=Botrytis galanthina TaxID=278940 RepID=A0A4S8R545_9HELO|nr:hypothetical protein BGAL_0062g00140 [Botrytis galanthina]
MSLSDFLTPPCSGEIKMAETATGTMELEELNARAHPWFKAALEAKDTIKLGSISFVEEWIRIKRELQSHHRKANISKDGYGLTEQQIVTYRTSADKFENFLVAHATSGTIPYVVDLKISNAQYKRLLGVYEYIFDKLSICDAIYPCVESLEFLERWSRLQRPVFFITKTNTEVDRWNEKIKEKDFELRESSHWGPLYSLYEQWAMYETDFRDPQRNS